MTIRAWGYGSSLTLLPSLASNLWRLSCPDGQVLGLCVGVCTHSWLLSCFWYVTLYCGDFLPRKLSLWLHSRFSSAVTSDLTRRQTSHGQLWSSVSQCVCWPVQPSDAPQHFLNHFLLKKQPETSYPNSRLQQSQNGPWALSKTFLAFCRCWDWQLAQKWPENLL